MRDDWREPYRSMDASGDPTTAGAVGWEWINQVAGDLNTQHPGRVIIDAKNVDRDGTAMVVYLDTKCVAVATVFRDPLNFAVLVRWRAQ